MSLEGSKKAAAARRKQDIMNQVLSFGEAYSPENEDMDFTKSMVKGFGNASAQSAAAPEVGADQTGNTIQKAGALAAPLLMYNTATGATGAAGAGALGSAGTTAGAGLAGAGAGAGGTAALGAGGLSAGATTGAAAGTAGGLGTAGTMAALSNPVTAAAIIGGTMLAGGLAQNQANKEARERGANAANFQRQSEIAMDTARQKQNAFNQLMQGYSAALR